MSIVTTALIKDGPDADDISRLRARPCLPANVAGEKLAPSSTAEESHSMARYRSAIIACGTIARCHARGWQGVPDVELAAIADTHAGAREEFGEHFGVPTEHQYADYREMLDAERPDFVDVCSWHGLHAEMVIAAAARQPKAILSQKPMSLSLGECDRMLTACAREGVKLVVGHQRRHLAGWLEAKRQVDQGIIGT